MFKQYEILSCPFCKQNSIQAIYFPSAWSEKRTGKNSLGRGVSKNKSSDEWSITSGCNSCGKSLEEIEEKFKQTGFL